MSAPQLSSPKAVLDLFAHGKKVSFTPGEVLFREGDAVSDVFCVIDGNVVVTRFGENGERQILAFLFPGDFLGMTFTPQHNTGAEAMTAGALWSLPRSKLQHVLATQAEMGVAFAEMSARILNNALDLIFTLGRKNSRARVASFLLHLRTRQELLGLEANRIHVPMTRQDIADFLGLTMETVSRSFSQLKASGAIRAEAHGDVVVSDMTALRAAAELARD
ncbi:MAG: Crp/Fnr family transcriptional regulator [Rhodospirillaceae bacterium]|nr:Crp/Fnr family transcriptional regulator [Rhodospirillaceae bacterium]